MKCITLRRTKSSEVNGRPLVCLPEKTVCMEQVTLSQSEREEYELARNEGRKTISRYVSLCKYMRMHCMFESATNEELVDEVFLPELKAVDRRT